MPDTPVRFKNVKRWISLGRVLLFMGLVSIAVVGGYLFTGETDPGFRSYLLGIGVIAAALLLSALFIYLGNFVNLLLKIEGNSFRSYGVLCDLQSSLEKQQRDLQSISENAQLSDVVRAVTHRGRERTALRLAINEEIIRGDWEAAYALVELLESRHGYKNEAARLRAEVDQSRIRENRDKLQESIEELVSHMRSHDWDWSRRQMDRLVAEHPDNAEVRELPRLFAGLRNEHKRRLLKEWDESVQRNEVDRGIGILKQLDQYLTPNEAAALEESARGVFRAKLHNLGVQFSLAVTEQNWQEAHQVGQQIVREFPNSRMAEEVKERIHVLAKRASQAIEEPETADAAHN